MSITVKQLTDQLQKMCVEGKGEYSVMAMHVEDGITFGADVRFVVGHEDDGEVVWILVDEELIAPEWAV
jgi:hypothetical protein